MYRAAARARDWHEADAGPSPGGGSTRRISAHHSPPPTAFSMEDCARRVFRCASTTPRTQDSRSSVSREPSSARPAPRRQTAGRAERWESACMCEHAEGWLAARRGV